VQQQQRELYASSRQHPSYTQGVGQLLHGALVTWALPQQAAYQQTNVQTQFVQHYPQQPYLPPPPFLQGPYQIQPPFTYQHPYP